MWAINRCLINCYHHHRKHKKYRCSYAFQFCWSQGIALYIVLCRSQLLIWHKNSPGVRYYLYRTYHHHHCWCSFSWLYLYVLTYELFSTAIFSILLHYHVNVWRFCDTAQSLTCILLVCILQLSFWALFHTKGMLLLSCILQTKHSTETQWREVVRCSKIPQVAKGTLTPWVLLQTIRKSNFTFRYLSSYLPMHEEYLKWRSQVG